MINAVAIQIAGSIQIRNCRSLFGLKPIDADGDKLFFHTGDNRYFYIFKYGVLGFFNMTPEDQFHITQKVIPFAKDLREDPISEEILVEIHPHLNKVTFDCIHTTTLSGDTVRVILLNLASSVVLDRFTVTVETILEDTKVHTAYLEEKGRLSIRGNRLIRYIARVLNVKNSVAENLYILDNSDLTWEDEGLTKLDSELKVNFDINERQHYLEDQLGVISENLGLFKDIMQHRESTLLEWIIIILILIEVLDAFINKFY
ncbi:RMD1 family protein [Robertkochia solimangrovi]|uniref:RMD1 family protein n=1 Tax=Robertkochia solimangrovi TaxID=2213046 RepID=UPI00117EC400|nr:RMD1 family protein [Robertkochia solimangrovi]TRZ46091.1 RMD1 family protein [Robertkochia solimangrovi]